MQGVIFSDYNDADATSGDQPNWHAYLIRPAYLAWLGAQSTHWRATCRYDTDGVVYTDYMRTSLADCNILTMQKEYGTCFQFEFINIRGHECFNCTVPLWNEKDAYSLHTDTHVKNCEFDGKTGSVHREDNFGHYVRYNSLHRCSSGSDSTTQFWLGGKWMVVNYRQIDSTYVVERRGPWSVLDHKEVFGSDMFKNGN